MFRPSFDVSNGVNKHTAGAQSPVSLLLQHVQSKWQGLVARLRKLEKVAGRQDKGEQDGLRKPRGRPTKPSIVCVNKDAEVCMRSWCWLQACVSTCGARWLHTRWLPYLYQGSSPDSMVLSFLDPPTPTNSLCLP